MPSRFGWRGADIWVPLMIDRADPRFVSIRGRLKPGVTLMSAAEQLRVIHQGMESSFPRYYPRGGFNISMYSLRDGVIREFRTTLYILFAAVILLLLIGCANVTNLQLARATERHREMAIRCAVGARPGRLVRQLLTESLLLSVAGAAGGVILAIGGTRALVALMPPFGIPNEARITVNGDVLLFSASLAIAAGVLSGLAPALAGSRLDLVEALKEGARGAGQARHGARIRAGLVAGEMALALVLLVGAGLMLRSFAAYRSVDLGFRPENLLTMRIPLAPARYSKPTQRNLFYGSLLQRLAVLPGIRTAAVSNSLPPWSNAATEFAVEGRPAQEQVRTAVYFVSGDYFRTLGASLLRGQMFREQDEMRGERPAVISNFMASHFFEGEDPLGKRIHLGLLQNAGLDSWRTVVGVVSTIRNSGVEDEPRPAIYLPYTAMPGAVRFVLARTERDPTALGPVARAQVSAIDKDQAVGDISTAEQELDIDEARPRFSVVLTTTFAAIGLLLSMAGIYGVVSYTFSRRTQEIGVRMAFLGADPGQIIRMVLRSGLRLASWGIAIGSLGAWCVTRLIKHLLYQVSPVDPLSFCAAAIVLTAAALAACCIPARRSARTNPQEALRWE